MADRMRTFLRTVVIGVLLVVAGAQLYLPPFMEARLGESLQQSVGIESLDVHLQTFPAVKMLTGAVGYMVVSAADVTVDGLRIEALQLEARGVRVDVSQLVRDGTFSVRSGDDLSVRMTVTSGALTEYVRERPELPPGAQVDVTEQGVELAGRVTLLGNTIDAAVAGHFESDGRSGIVFVPDDISVEGQSLPPFIVATLRQAYTVKADLGAGPLPMVVEKVIHTPGKLVVVGRPLLDDLSSRDG